MQPCLRASLCIQAARKNFLPMYLFLIMFLCLNFVNFHWVISFKELVRTSFLCPKVLRNWLYVPEIM